MDKFASRDPTIYSTNHSFHMNRVLIDNYAYIGDTSGFEQAMSELCDIDMIRDEMFPYQYSLAVQKNSAYWAKVNQE